MLTSETYLLQTSESSTFFEVEKTWKKCDLTSSGKKSSFQFYSVQTQKKYSYKESSNQVNL